jgi:molybdenum cofactor biosynthesis enzyme
MTTRKIVTRTLTQFSDRGIKGSTLRTGKEVHVQDYDSGPDSIAMFLHVGLCTQVAVHIARETGTVRVIAEARRNAKTGMRLLPSEREALVAQKLAAAVAAALIPQLTPNGVEVLNDSAVLAL